MRDFSYQMQQMSDFSCKNQGREPGRPKKKTNKKIKNPQKNAHPLISVLTSPFREKKRMSGHLLNLDSNYIHVIWVEQLLQETQTFTRGFLCMLVREELKLFSTSVRTSPFPSLKTLVSGHLLDLVCIGFWWLWLRLAFGFWLWFHLVFGLGRFGFYADI